MKKILVSICIIFVIMPALFGNEKSKNSSSVKVLILPFSTGGNVNKQYGEIAEKTFSSSISKSKNFEAITFKDENIENSEKQEQNDSTNIDIAKFYGAEILFYGDINNLNNSYTITVRGVDVNSKTTDYIERGVFSNKDELISVTDSIAKKINSNFIAKNSKTADKFSLQSENDYELYKQEKASGKLQNDTDFNKSEKTYIRKYLYPADVNIFDIDEMEGLYVKQKRAGNGLLAGAIISSAVGQLALVGYIFTSIFTPMSYGMPIAYLFMVAFTSPVYGLMIIGNLLLGLMAFTLMTLPFVLIPLAAVAYWHANNIKKITEKTHGEDIFSGLEKRNLLINDSDKISFDMFSVRL